MVRWLHNDSNTHRKITEMGTRGTLVFKRMPQMECRVVMAPYMPQHCVGASFPPPHPILHLGIPCALVKLME